MGSDLLKGTRLEVDIRMYLFLTNMLARLRREDQGQTMVEYALILFLVSIVALLILTLLGVRISGIFTTIANTLV